MLFLLLLTTTTAFDQSPMAHAGDTNYFAVTNDHRLQADGTHVRDSLPRQDRGDLARGPHDMVDNFVRRRDRFLNHNLGNG